MGRERRERRAEDPEKKTETRSEGVRESSGEERPEGGRAIFQVMPIEEELGVENPLQKVFVRFAQPGEEGSLDPDTYRLDVKGFMEVRLLGLAGESWPLCLLSFYLSFCFSLSLCIFVCCKGSFSWGLPSLEPTPLLDCPSVST